MSPMRVPRYGAPNGRVGRWQSLFYARLATEFASLKTTSYTTTHNTSRSHQNYDGRSEEHTSELQSLMRISYAVFCLKKKKKHYHNTDYQTEHTQTHYNL